jgi:prevent-host-death family protein
MPNQTIPPTTLSIEEFNRRPAELLSMVRMQGQPLVLTENGEAELVVHTAADYQLLVEQMERVLAIEGIRRGLDSMKSGRGKPADEVFALMEGKFPYLRRS